MSQQGSTLNALDLHDNRCVQAYWGSALRAQLLAMPLVLITLRHCSCLILQPLHLPVSGFQLASELGNLLAQRLRLSLQASGPLARYGCLARRCHLHSKQKRIGILRAEATHEFRTAARLH